MKVQFINNKGGGFAEDLELDAGVTAGALFDTKMGSVDPGDYLIRVNRAQASADQVLLPGDKMTVTPTKVQGA